MMEDIPAGTYDVLRCPEDSRKRTEQISLVLKFNDLRYGNRISVDEPGNVNP